MKDDLIDILEEEIPDTVSMRLECAKCGHTARYETKEVFVDPDARSTSKRPEECVSFGSYFRCRKCKSAWPWKLTPDATLALTALMVAKAAGIKDDRLVFGVARLYDGTPFRSAAQAEEYLLGILEREPDNALVWNRLGNVYNRADLYPKASKAFAKALELDPKDLESHYSLGGILFDRGSYKRAAQHLHHLMRLARGCRSISDEHLRNIVRDSLGMLCRIGVETDGEVEVLPPLKRAERRVLGEPATLDLETYDLAKEADRERFVDMIVGKPQRPIRRIPTPAGVRRKIGRNDPCPCGSGVKYKKCCGK